MDVARCPVTVVPFVLLLPCFVVAAMRSVDAAAVSCDDVTTATAVAETRARVWNPRGSEHKWYDIYYDVITSKKIPMVQRFGDRQDEPNTARFGRIPCSCQNSACGCCTQFNVRLFDYNKRGCMNLTYEPSDFAIKGNMFMDDESVYEYKISAKNPPPACMQVPVPYVPSMDVCLKMFDIHTVGRNLHACVNFLTRIEHAEVLVLEFDCFVVGRDGVSVEKYNATSSSTAAAVPETLDRRPMQRIDPEATDLTDVTDHEATDEDGADTQ